MKSTKDATSLNQSSAPSLRFGLICLALLMVAGLAMRAWSLGGTSLWLDEILQLRCTMQGPGAVWECSPANKPPLDYYIQSVIAGQYPPEWRVRLHAWVFGSGFLAVMACLAWRIGGAAFAFAALLAVVLSPVHIRFSQEGRPYSLMLLTEAVFLGALWNIVHARRWEHWADWLALTAAVILAVWAFYMNLIAIAAALLIGALFVLSSRESRRELFAVLVSPKFLIRLAACLALIALALTPLAWRTHQRFDPAQRLPWQGWSLPRLQAWLDIFACGYDWYLYRRGAVWLAAIYAGVGLIGGLTRPAARRATLLIFSLFAAMLLGSLAAYAAMDQHVEMRYLLIAFVPFSLLVALGIWIAGAAGAQFLAHRRKQPQHNLRLTFALCLLAAAPWLIVQGHFLASHWVARTDWRGLADRFKAESHQNSVVFVGDYLDEIALGHYFEKYELSTPIQITDYNPAQAAEMIQSGERDVWLILRDDTAPPEFWTSLPPAAPDNYFLLEVRRYHAREGGAP